MSTDMSNAEQEIPRPREEQVAKRWLKMRGVTPPQGAEPAGFLDKLKETVVPKGKAPQAPEQLVSQAYDLFVEKQDLKDDIVAKQRGVMEPATSSGTLSLEEKRKLIQQGRISALLPTAGEALPYKEVIGKSQARIEEIDNQLDQIFRTPGIYDRFVQDLTHQVRVRHQAREVKSLDRFIETANLVSVRLTREGQVQGRTLTSVEQGVISDNRTLREEAEKRKAELLKDAEVFDRVRILELQQYRQELKHRFAVTPSRRKAMDKLERLISEGRKVLVSSVSGTGKTELIRRVGRELLGKEPYEVTGHREMTPYELLGKTGFQMKQGEGGDTYRPSQLFLALGIEDGEGGMFFYDEMDASPNEANIAIKTRMNDQPGTLVRVQMNSGESFRAGNKYCFVGAANIKDEKHTTRYDLDPAIVRVLEPMNLDYMPAYEVYDLALASLMDKRGGIPLSESDARVLLKNLCDAASWIQDAYQGRKVVTDPASGTFLEARGQAATGKAATLKKALLDPGRTLDMLRGWTAAQTRGVTFEDYINERLLEFINNRAYPEEDRYYLTEIFALKGFLKGHKISELMVSGLDQGTLDRWAGSVNKKQTAGKTTPAYLPWNRVAKLDPYRRFKRPVSAEAEELLEEEAPEEEKVVERGGPMIERAKNLLGKDFLGPEAIKAMENKFKGIGVNVEFIIDHMPAFPYTEEDLRVAKENGEMVVLRPEAMLMGGRQVDLTVVELINLFQKDPQGKLSHPIYPYDWFDEETWATGGLEMKARWAIVKKDVLDGSTSKTWNDQETVLKQYSEGLKRKGAKNTDVRRRTALEATWDSMLYYTNTGERILPDKWDWTQTRSSFGLMVLVGGFDQNGLSVYSDNPGISAPLFGVCPSR